MVGGHGDWLVGPLPVSPTGCGDGVVGGGRAGWCWVRRPGGARVAGCAELLTKHVSVRGSACCTPTRKYFRRDRWPSHASPAWGASRPTNSPEDRDGGRRRGPGRTTRPNGGRTGAGRGDDRRREVTGGCGDAAVGATLSQASATMPAPHTVRASGRDQAIATKAPRRVGDRGRRPRDRCARCRASDAVRQMPRPWRCRARITSCGDTTRLATPSASTALASRGLRRSAWRDQRTASRR